MSQTHKRVVVSRRGGPEVLRVDEEPLPTPRPGEVRVKVPGAGVGTALLDLGRIAGLAMYGTASRGKHALVESLGGTPIDYKTTDFVARVRDLTGDGVDAVFDAVGGAQWRRSYEALRAGGRL